MSDYIVWITRILFLNLGSKKEINILLPGKLIINDNIYIHWVYMAVYMKGYQVGYKYS